ncbi:MAG: hypothetical protein IJ714_06020 [Bacteroidales bacterium]|nr:hypothetical protein [Bacteroidales bacterium]
MKRFFLLLTLMLGVGAQAQNVAHLNRYAAANEALPAICCGPRVVLYGDSITDGWASQRPDFFAQTGFIGRGISGEETAQMLLRFRQDVLNIHASTFVLLEASMTLRRIWETRTWKTLPSPISSA